MVSIEPAILAADVSRLGVQAVEAEAAGVESLQVDVMDGHFVPDITVGPGMVKALRSLVRLNLNVHLLIDEPLCFIRQFTNAGANRVTIHIESSQRLPETIAAIKEQGIDAGLALMPDTEIENILGFLDVVDYVQILTADPAVENAEFMKDQLGKIRKLKSIISEKSLEIKLGADGAIDSQTAPEIVKAGAEILVIGRGIYQQPGTVAQNILAIQDAIEKIEI